MTGSADGVSRTIWFLWFQGLENAPPVVRMCHESWVSRNPGWRVITLDAATLGAFTPVRYSEGNIARLTLQHRADLLRLDLLARHGGVWADATCFCVRPLDEWLPPNTGSGFFAFHQPGPDRVISNWFLAARRGNVLVTRLFDRMMSYWGDQPLRNPKRGPAVNALTRLLRCSRWTRGLWFTRPLRNWLSIGPYFAFHYAFEQLVHDDAECARVWSRTPRVSADGPHRLWRAGLLSPASDELRSEIDRRAVPVYKTAWNLGSDPIPDGSVLSYLLQMTHTSQTGEER